MPASGVELSMVLLRPTILEQAASSGRSHVPSIIHKYINPLILSPDMFECPCNRPIIGKIDLDSLHCVTCLDLVLQLGDGGGSFGERTTAHEDVVGRFRGVEKGAVDAASHHHNLSGGGGHAGGTIFPEADVMLVALQEDG